MTKNALWRVETEVKSKQELIEKWESAIESAEFYGKGKEDRLIEYMRDFVDDLYQLDEPEYVAEWIEEAKNLNGDPVNAIWEMYENETYPIYSWVAKDNNSEVLMQAMVNGYEVELTDSFNINSVVVSKIKNLLIPTQHKKVKLPKFVVDEIEQAQGEGVSLYDTYYTTRKLEGNLDEWMSTENNDELYARAWLDGYEIEPKRYCIPLPNLVTSDGEQQYLTQKGDKFFASRWNTDLRQEWNEEDLQYIPYIWRKYAVEVE